MHSLAKILFTAYGHVWGAPFPEKRLGILKKNSHVVIPITFQIAWLYLFILYFTGWLKYKADFSALSERPLQNRISVQISHPYKSTDSIVAVKMLNLACQNICDFHMLPISKQAPSWSWYHPPWVLPMHHGIQSHTLFHYGSTISSRCCACVIWSLIGWCHRQSPDQ